MTTSPTTLTPVLTNVKKYDGVEIYENLFSPNIDVQETLEVLENTNYSSIQIGGVTLQPAVGSNYTLTFPTTPGTTGQALTSDGNGNMVWSSGANPLATLTTNDIAPTATRLYVSNTTQSITGLKTFTQIPVLNNNLSLSTSFFNLPSGTITFDVPQFYSNNSNFYFFVNYIGSTRIQTTTNLANFSSFRGINNSGSTAGYTWALDSYGGSTTTGSGSFMWRAANINLIGPGQSTCNFIIDNVTIPRVDKLNYVVGVTNGYASSNKAVVVDAARNVYNLNTVKTNTVAYQRLQHNTTNQLVISTGSSVEMSSNYMVYRAQTASGLCELILQQPNNAMVGRIVYVIRDDTTGIHPLAITGTPYNVVINGSVQDVFTTEPMKVFMLIATADEWYLL
jgi:hypothetical protein